MAKSWITQPRDRKSKRYVALHAQLKQELEEDRIKSSKRLRKKARSQEHRMGMA